jgi:hypothetical protein
MFTVSIWCMVERFMIVNEFTYYVSALLRYRPFPASLCYLVDKLRERHVAVHRQPIAQKNRGHKYSAVIKNNYTCVSESLVSILMLPGPSSLQQMWLLG